MMDFRLNEDQIQLQKAAADFLSKESTKEVVFAAFEGEDGDSPELYKKMADLGWLALAVPEDQGGLGMGLVEQAVLLEQLGYYAAPGAFFTNACISIPALLALGANDESSAVLDGGKKVAFVIDPEFVIDGHLADSFLVTVNGRVRLLGGADVKVKPLDTIDGTRRAASVEFSEQAGEDLGDVHAVESVVDAATAILCAEMVGGMQKSLDMVLDYVKVRTQFGRPVGSFQSIKHRLADMLLKTEASRSAAYYAAWANQSGADDAALSASVAKAYVSDAAPWVTGQCIQLHGGIGFTWEHEAHLYFKRATMNTALLGDVAFHRERALTLTTQTR